MSTGITSVYLDEPTHKLTCLNPNVLKTYADSHGYATDHWYGKANSFHQQSGRLPGYGWILLTRKQLNSIPASRDFNKFHTLTFKDQSKNLSILFQKIIVVSAIALYGDNLDTTSDNTAYLLTLTDKKHLLDMSVIPGYGGNRGIYNVRSSVPTDDTGTGIYYDNSVKAGPTVWTWQTMLDDLWNTHVLLSGTSTVHTAASSPTLPYSPDGVPDGFTFQGMNALEAYHSILDKLRCVLIYNPFTDVFTIERLGVTQSGLTTTVSNLRKYLAADIAASTNCIAAAIPARVEVFFPVRRLHYGTENDLDNAAQENSAFSIAANLSVTGSFTGTRLAVWDDLPQILDAEGNATNSAELTARAAEITANIKSTLQSETHYRKKFFGCHATLLTGSQVRQVSIYDFGDAAGMCTEIIRYPVLTQPVSSNTLFNEPNPRPILPKFLGGMGGPITSLPEKYRGRSWGNESPYHQTRETQMILVGAGPNADGVFLGGANVFDPDDLTTISGGASVAVYFPIPVGQETLYERYFKSLSTVAGGSTLSQYHIGRLTGSVEVDLADFEGGGSGVFRYPLFLVDAPPIERTHLKVKATENWHYDGFGADAQVDVNPVYNDGPDTGDTFTVHFPDSPLLIPNVELDQEFWVMIVTGTYYLDAQFSPECMDRPIGTVEWRTTTLTRQGWGIMDGTGNDTSVGGSNLDLITGKKLLRSHTGAGATSTVQSGAGVDAIDLIPYERLDNREP